MEKNLKNLGTFEVKSEKIKVKSKGYKHPSVDVWGEKFYLPSPNLHTLFLVKHVASHFTGANITHCQMFVWAFFIKKHLFEIDWKWFDGTLEKCLYVK